MSSPIILCGNKKKNIMTFNFYSESLQNGTWHVNGFIEKVKILNEIDSQNEIYNKSSIIH